MSWVKYSGQPFVGLVSLTNGAPGPTNFTINTVAGVSAGYTLAANERLIITNITITSNDTAQPLITLDDGASGRTFGKYYTGSTLPAVTESIPPGNLQCKAGVLPRASASAVTTAKTVEVTIRGYVTQTV